MKPPILLLLSLIFCNSALWAVDQEPGDSLKNIWEDQAMSDSLRFKALEEFVDRYEQSRSEEALENLEVYHELAIEKGDQRRIFRAFNKKANIYRLKEQYTLALELYDQAEQQAELLEIPRLKAIVSGNKGNVYFYQKEYNKAIRNYSDALLIFQEKPDPQGVARMLLSIGNVNSAISNHDLALEYYDRALQTYKELNANLDNQKGIGVLYMNKGLIHYRKKAYVASKASFERAIQVLEAANASYYIVDCHIYLARNLLALDRLDEAMTNSKMSLEMAAEFKMKSSLFESEMISAFIQARSDPEKALEMGERILSKLPEYADEDHRSELFEFLYSTYRASGQWEKALDMHERFLESAERLNERKNSYAVAREAVKNEYELMLREKELANERQQAELRVRQVKRTAGLIGGSVLLFSLLLLAIYIGNKKSREKRDILLAEIEQLKSEGPKELIVSPKKFELSRIRLESHIGKELNDTDWKVLQILFNNPMIMNKEIAEEAFLSVDGIGSSLRRMYKSFKIQETKYKKMALLLEVMKLSNG